MAGTRAHAAAAAVPAAGIVAAGSTASPAAAGSLSSTDVRVREGIRTSPTADRQLAARLPADIDRALRGRAGQHAVTVHDAVTGLSCHAGSGRHFESASIVKAIILGALLRWHQETSEPLSSLEQQWATLMITRSDNDAATGLWNKMGLRRLQDFLDLAKMDQTRLDTDGRWGLTQVTAHDEMLLLKLLTLPNSVLWPQSREYQLELMARVIPSQRWGTPAGAPGDVTVHVKNGWLPGTAGWHINSIGAFTGTGKNYLIAVLSDDNPSERYGIDTIEAVARVVHRALNETRPIAGPAPG